MSERGELELEDPAVSGPCPCCGGTTVSLTRFVYRGGDAHAVYYARYTNGHPDDEIHLIASLDEWGQGATAAQRAAFFCRLRHGENGYGVMLDDAGQSPWADAELLGQKLSREQALAHPMKQALFELTDHVARHDPSVRGFLERVECGDSGFLEYATRRGIL